jgi:hypothetical protein
VGERDREPIRVNLTVDRYANHRSGKKYDDEGKVRPQEPDALDGEKARAARVFYERYVEAREDEYYKQRRKEWTERYG